MTDTRHRRSALGNELHRGPRCAQHRPSACLTQVANMSEAGDRRTALSSVLRNAPPCRDAAMALYSAGTHTRRMHARMHARMRARMHACMHTRMPGCAD